MHTRLHLTGAAPGARRGAPIPDMYGTHGKGDEHMREITATCNAV